MHLLRTHNIRQGSPIPVSFGVDYYSIAPSSAVDDKCCVLQLIGFART